MGLALITAALAGLNASRDVWIVVLVLGMTALAFALLSHRYGKRRDSREGLADDCQKLGDNLGGSYRAYCERHPAQTPETERDFVADYVDRYFHEAKRLYETLGKDFAESNTSQHFIISQSVAHAIALPAQSAEVGHLATQFREYAKRLREAG